MINAVRPHYETTALPYEHPPILRAVVTDQTPKCWRCRRVLAGKMSRPWEKRCERCGAENASEPER